MTSEQIQERITKCEEKLNKAQILLEKKKSKLGLEVNLDLKWVELRGLYYNTVDYSKWCEIESVKQTHDKIKDIQSTIAKYQDQLNKAQIKERKLVSIPQVLVDYKEYIINEWDSFDLKRKETLRKEYKEIGYSEFIRKYTYQNYNFIGLSEKEIHNENVKSAEAIILNLLERTEEIVGVITDCSHLYIDSDNLGYAVINGVIEGTNGKCTIESIGAGGYNIQKWHIRVLVKPVK